MAKEQRLLASQSLQGGALPRGRKGEEIGVRAAQGRRGGGRQAHPAAPLPSAAGRVLTAGPPVSQRLPVAPLLVQGALLGLRTVDKPEGMSDTQTRYTGTWEGTPPSWPVSGVGAGKSPAVCKEW